MRFSKSLLTDWISTQKARGQNRSRDEHGRQERNGGRGVTRPFVPPRRNTKDLPQQVYQARRGPLIVGGLAVYCVVFYGTYLYISLGNTSKTSKTGIPEDVSDRYNYTARSFDRDVNTTEKLMGLGWLRRSLTKKACGHVLEVSVGTGRNVSYYDTTKCSSITFVDQSAEMMEIARKKFNGTSCLRRLESSRFSGLARLCAKTVFEQIRILSTRTAGFSPSPLMIPYRVLRLRGSIQLFRPWVYARHPIRPLY